MLSHPLAAFFFVLFLSFFSLSAQSSVHWCNILYQDPRFANCTEKNFSVGASINRVEVITDKNAINWYVKKEFAYDQAAGSAISELLGSAVTQYFLGESFAPYNEVIPFPSGGAYAILSKEIKNYYPFFAFHNQSNWFDQRQNQDDCVKASGITTPYTLQERIVANCYPPKNLSKHLALMLLLAVVEDEGNFGYILDGDDCYLAFVDFQSSAMWQRTGNNKLDDQEISFNKATKHLLGITIADFPYEVCRESFLDGCDLRYFFSSDFLELSDEALLALANIPPANYRSLVVQKLQDAKDCFQKNRPLQNFSKIIAYVQFVLLGIYHSQQLFKAVATHDISAINCPLSKTLPINLNGLRNAIISLSDVASKDLYLVVHSKCLQFEEYFRDKGINIDDQSQAYVTYLTNMQKLLKRLALDSLNHPL